MELYVKLDVNETVSLGDIIKIEMMDGSVIEREVKIINPKKAGDYYSVSKEARELNWGRSKKPVLSVTGECQCNICEKSTLMWSLFSLYIILRFLF